MEFMNSWGWPEWTWIALAFLALFIHAAMHGKPVAGNYNFMVKVLSIALTAFILFMGGFF